MKPSHQPRPYGSVRERDRLQNLLQDAHQEQARLAARIAALESSSSWKLTAPLRAVVTAGHRASLMGRRARGVLAQLAAKARQAMSLDKAPSDHVPAGPAPRGIHPAVPRQMLPRRVLIVAETSIPQCLRYRVRQKADALESMGYPTTIISWREELECRRALPAHGCVIFYRTPAEPQVIAMAREARRLGMSTFFEMDDLVFDVDEYARNSNLASLPAAERASLLRGAELYRDMLRHVDHAIASTSLLAERFRKLGARNTFVVENALDASLLAAAARVHPRPPTDGLTIIYGSGTDTHDADFALVATPLARVMDERPCVRLLLAGPLKLPPSLDHLLDRIVRIPLLPQEDYQACLARADINLAPLEPTLFNEAKSNIKYLEASVLGLPSICSPCAEFRAAITDGENGFLAGTEEEWGQKLSRLITDTDLRLRLGATARARVLQDYAPDTRTRQQLEPILGVAFGPAARVPALKILTVNVHFAPESFGGATIVAEQICAGLARLPDTEVSIFTGTSSGDTPLSTLRRYQWNGLAVYAARLPPAGESAHDHENRRVARLFAEALDCVQPDVVHFHCVQMLSADLVGIARQRGIPHVISLHDAWWICERQFMIKGDGHYCGQRGVDPLECVGCTPDPGFTQRRFRRLWEELAGATHLLTPSAFFRELYIQTGIDPDRISVSRNGVLPAKPQPKRSAQTANDPRVTLAYLGGRGVHKGYFWLQEILAGTKESNYRLKVCDLSLIHGHRSIARSEWNIAGELAITAPYHQESIDNYFSDIDVLLFPSLWKESFGLTVREALLRDIWVISTDCGGPVEDLVDGVNATIVPMGDTLAFREAVRAVLLDPQRFRDHVNPHKERIRSFAEQARETRAFLAEAATAKI